MHFSHAKSLIAVCAALDFVPDASAWILHLVLSSSELRIPLSGFKNECWQRGKCRWDDAKDLFLYWRKGTRCGRSELRSGGPAASRLILLCAWAMERLANQSPYNTHSRNVCAYVPLHVHVRRKKSNAEPSSMLVSEFVLVVSGFLPFRWIEAVKAEN